MQNTKISYLYRDASNYKQWNEAVIKGILTKEDIQTILDHRIERTWFVPRKVNLPEVRFEDSWTEDDHDYFELDEDGFEIVDEEPTVNITAQELVEAFKRMEF